MRYSTFRAFEGEHYFRYALTNTTSTSYSGKVLTEDIGSLLVEFLKYDFKNDKSFGLFISKFGVNSISGICEPEYLLFEKAYYNIGVKSEIWEKERSAAVSVWSNAVRPFLVECSDDFKTALNYCINSEKKPYLENLSFNERYFVGSLAKNRPIPDLEKYNGKLTPVFEFDRKSNDLLQYAIDSKLTDIEIVKAMKKHLSISNEVYYTYDIRHVLFVEFQKLLLMDKCSIRKCENCGDFFIPTSRSNEVYCDKVYSAGKTCKQVGFYNRLMNDESMILEKEYRKAYKTKNAQKQRQSVGKSESYKKALNDKRDKWAEEGAKKLVDVKNNKMTSDEFLAWLKEPIEWRK
jgi:hypothetical protein